MQAAWGGLGMKYLPWLTHPTCSKSQSQTYPGLQIPEEHWALAGTLLDVVLMVMTLPCPIYGMLSSRLW